MFVEGCNRKCQVVVKLTDAGKVFCLKPATVVIAFKMPGGDLGVMCPDCARELAKELVDSVPGGRLDVDLVTIKRKGRR